MLSDLIRLLPGRVHSYGGCQHNHDLEPGTYKSKDRWRQKEVGFCGWGGDVGGDGVVMGLGVLWVLLG